MFRLYFGHAFQQFVRLVQFVGLGVDLGKVAHGLKVFLNGKGFSEAFDGVVCTAHALCTHTVILEYLKILLLVFCFSFAGLSDLPEKKDLKNPIGD